MGSRKRVRSRAVLSSDRRQLSPFGFDARILNESFPGKETSRRWQRKEMDRGLFAGEARMACIAPEQNSQRDHLSRKRLSLSARQRRLESRAAHRHARNRD